MFHTRPGDADGVHFLKCVGANQVAWHLTGDHHERCRIHVGICDTRNCVCRSWTRGDKHHSDAPCGACVTFGHVHGALLVPDQVMTDSISRPPEFVVDVKHRSTGITKDRIHAFEDQRFDEHFGGRRHLRDGRTFLGIENLWLRAHVRRLMWTKNVCL